MMGYFMFFFKKNNLNLYLFLVLVSNLGIAVANLNINIEKIILDSDQDKIIINIGQNSFLSPNIIELLERGIPISFNLQIKFIKKNKFWFDKVIKKKKLLNKIKYHSLIREYEVVDINGNKKNFKNEKEAIQFLLDNKKIVINDYNQTDNTKLKIWVELDKDSLPKAIQADIFNKTWDLQSNTIFYDMNKL
tara:strand:- start:845 stop:1417 length:573 start_codon:yes stop_codon:yes gene_type:complete